MSAIAAPTAISAIPFVRNFDPAYGTLAEVSPLIRRLVAPNKSAFTAWGSGTYVVGRGEVAVIDPGPDDAAHIDTLLARLGGERISHIVVTHTHLDHSPGARLLQARLLAAGAPVPPIVGCGPHARLGPNDEPVEEGGDFEHRPDTELHDGDAITGTGWTLTAVHTPGHTSNHLCYALAEERALFSGDHVMGWSTTVVSPPDGDMAHYIGSCRKLLARADQVLYPTHGAPITAPHAFITQLIAHRLAREDQIVACVRDGLDDIPAMVARLYADVDVGLHRAAARSVQAHLIALENEGRVAQAAGRYRVA